MQLVLVLICLKNCCLGVKQQSLTHGPQRTRIEGQKKSKFIIKGNKMLERLEEAITNEQSRDSDNEHIGINFSAHDTLLE